MADADYEYLDIEKLRNSLLGERDFRREYLNAWIESQPIYILASSYQLAKAIFNHYFLFTNLARRIDLRYIDTIEKVYGLRNVYIVVSNELYPYNSFYERLRFLRDNAKYREFELVNEQDLENEQVREKVSRQRPKEAENK